MGNSYRCIAKTFAIGKLSAVKISKDFCSALRLQLCTYINLPDSSVATKHAIEAFKADYNCKIPQSLGTVDCTHIFMKSPNCENKYDSYCRKQRYSINTQVVVGANLHFLDVEAGFLASMHDKRVLRQANVFQRTESSKILHVPVKKI